MKKLKLIALLYSSQDEKTISKWLAKYGQSVELCHSSNHLTVPIQLAVAHFCTMYSNEIDGLIIDDYAQYDPIVVNQLQCILEQHKLALFSARHQLPPVAGCTTAYSLLRTVKLPGASQSIDLSTVA